jgi:hypothetical protein
MLYLFIPGIAHAMLIVHGEKGGSKDTPKTFDKTAS